MTEQPRRDWDRELADIDRAIAKQGGTPAPGAPAPARAPAPAGAAPRRRSVALTWFWMLLALALAAALLLWPYQHGCGLQLIFLLGAAGVTAVIAVLAAVASWSHHRPLAHVVSLLVLLWAGFVVVREVLPRVGYARTSRTWMCTTEPAAPARAAPAPAPAAPAPTGTARRPPTRPRRNNGTHFPSSGNLWRKASAISSAVSGWRPTTAPTSRIAIPRTPTT